MLPPPPPPILYIKNILEIIQKFSKNYWTKNAKLIESFFDRVKSSEKRADLNKKQCF